MHPRGLLSYRSDCLGTDATIAEHISKIIERDYVEARQNGAVKYLVPSDLGIGLIDGYNRIGFDRSLSKPHLRREVRPLRATTCITAEHLDF
jgi:DNA topoisomerase-3